MLTPGKEDDVAARVRTGKPLPLVDLRIVDEDMAEQRDGVGTGEVVVRAPWLNAEYLKSPQATEDLWRGGMMHAGDVGHDAGGSLQITDRMKDVIKSGGEWVSSLALESLASAVGGVAEVAAIGIPDLRWGERLLLLVVAAEGGDHPTVGDATRVALLDECHPAAFRNGRCRKISASSMGSREDKRWQDRQEGASRSLTQD